MFPHSRSSITLTCQKFHKKPHLQLKLNFRIIHTLHRHSLSTKTRIPNDNKCNRCGKIGHYAKNCSEIINDKCNRCGMIGHWARDCTQPFIPHSQKYIKYPSISAAQKYGKIDAQIAMAQSSMNRINYESQLIQCIQSKQFNAAMHALHILMQQSIKLSNKALLPSILHSLKLSNNKHTQFHILELIDYIAFNQIQMNANVWAEILGICVHKNDTFSAKQIAFLWMEAMPNFPILPLIHCLSAQNSNAKRGKVWQTIMNELTQISVQETVTEMSEIIPSMSPMQYITELLSQIQSNLTAQNHELCVKNVTELHRFVTADDRQYFAVFQRQNSYLTENIAWNRWLITLELMNGSVTDLESKNNTLHKLYDLGFKTSDSVSNLWTDLAKECMHTSDGRHNLERRLPFICAWLTYNTRNAMIGNDVICTQKWIANMISVILDTVSQTNTANIPNKCVENLFDFMDSNYSNKSLIFHRNLFDYLKLKIVSFNLSNKNSEGIIRGKIVQKSNEFIHLRKLFDFVNGFSLKQMESIAKMNELRNEILPLMNACSIQLFYCKSKFFGHLLCSKDLTDAIIESAFRFDAKELGNLLYFLFYKRTPAIIDSDMIDFEHSTLPILPLKIDWRDLQKIYSTVLGLSNKALAQLKDIDFMHLLHYTPLPLTPLRNGESDSDTTHLIRKRQQRVLQILTGIYARYGHFENVMKCIAYFEHDSVITNNMRAKSVFYLNECLVHCFTENAVQIRNGKNNMSELEYVRNIKEMTQSIYAKWKECMSEILLDKSDNYSQYLLCLENLSSQIRMRQIVPLAQYLLYILDECNIAPTWNMYQNLWFAFNISDKYMPESDGSNVMQLIESDQSIESEEIDTQWQFETFSFDDTVQSDNTNVLDTKYAELQRKYVNTAHINYLLSDGRNEEGILMLHKYDIVHKVSDQYKLECIEKYVIDNELRNSVCNYYRFAVSQWFPQTNKANISAHYFVQRRIDAGNNEGIIYLNDWYKRSENVYIDSDTDLSFYIPMRIMNETKYKTEIIRHCKDVLFNSETDNKYKHLQLEILPFSVNNIDSKKLEANSMKRNYDLFIIRGCNTLEDKLSIWTEFISLFESKLKVLLTVSCDQNYNAIYNQRLNSFIHKISQKYQCNIDSNSISSLKCDNIPTFFIWKQSEMSDLQSAFAELSQYLSENNNYFRHKQGMLSVEISDEYYFDLHTLLYSDTKQINKDLRYVRDSHTSVKINIFEDKAKERNILSISAQTRHLRKRIFQQILYTHPPSNGDYLRVNDKLYDTNYDSFEWRDMNALLRSVIASMEDKYALTIANALYFARNNTHKFMTDLFKNGSEFALDCQTQMSQNEEMLKCVQLIFTALSQSEGSDSRTYIGHIFHNLLTNANISINNESLCQLLYCTLLSLCNHAMQHKSISMTDFHRIRAAFLHFYCDKSQINESDGMNENLQMCLEQITNNEAYLLIFLEYLYVSLLQNNPNLSGHICRFLNELLTLMVAETKVSPELSETYSQFVSAAMDLLLIDIGTPQRNIANAFISLFQNHINSEISMDTNHAIFSEMDVESLKLILSELSPLEIETVNVSLESIEYLYKNLMFGCSLCGNVECLKLLLNRVEFLWQNNGKSYTFGIDDSFLNKVLENVWIYYSETAAYDIEITVHAIMELIECLLCADNNNNKLWKGIISQDTLTSYAIFMAQNHLMQQMFDFKQLISQSCAANESGLFEELITVLSDVDYDLYLSQDSGSHLYTQNIKPV